MVEDGEDDTKQHLSDAKDDGHLHLVGVGEDKFVVSYTPDLIKEGKRSQGQERERPQNYIYFKLMHTQNSKDPPQ